jgi:hypothetical protein
MCDTRILARKEQAYISQCTHCKTIYLWHGNLLLNFRPDDFSLFREALYQREFCECATPFPDEEERVIIHSPVHDVSFTFSKAEWQNLQSVVDEALLMHQVYALL